MLGGQDFHVTHSHRKWQCSYKTPTLMFGWSSSKAHRVLFCKLLKFAHEITPTISLYPRSPTYISKMFVPGTSISHKRPFNSYQTPSNCCFPSHGHHVYPSAEWFPLFGVGSQDLNMEGHVTLYYSCIEFMHFDQAFVR